MKKILSLTLVSVMIVVGITVFTPSTQAASGYDPYYSGYGYDYGYNYNYDYTYRDNYQSSRYYDSGCYRGCYGQSSIYYNPYPSRYSYYPEPSGAIYQKADGEVLYIPSNTRDWEYRFPFGRRY